MAQAETDQLTPPRQGVKLPIEVTAITAILALALAVVAGAGAALYQKTRPSTYVSFSVLLIDQPSVLANDQDGGALAKLQALRYYYAGLLQTQEIADPVARQVNLPASVVLGDIAATIDPTSFTINIVAHAKTPKQASEVAQAATNELVGYVAKQQAHLNVPAANRVILDEASTPLNGLKVVTPTRKILLAATVGFVVVGAAFLIVADLFRRRW